MSHPRSLSQTSWTQYIPKCFFRRPQLTLIVSDLQAYGGWGVGEDNRQTVTLVVFAAEVDPCLAVTVQGSRVGPLPQQSVHHVCLLGYHRQMKGRLTGRMREKKLQLWQNSVFRSVTTKSHTRSLKIVFIFHTAAHTTRHSESVNPPLMMNNAPTHHFPQRHHSYLLKSEINRFHILYRCHYFETSICFSVIVTTKVAHLILEIPDPDFHQI